MILAGRTTRTYRDPPASSSPGVKGEHHHSWPSDTVLPYWVESGCIFCQAQILAPTPQMFTATRDSELHLCFHHRHASKWGTTFFPGGAPTPGDHVWKEFPEASPGPSVLNPRSQQTSAGTATFRAQHRIPQCARPGCGRVGREGWRAQPQEVVKG